MLITEIGKQITNSMVGLFIDSKNIPQNSKGEVLGTVENMIILRWTMKEQTITTKIEIKLYEELKISKVIDYLQNHIEIPASLFEPGDLIQGDDVSGVIKSKEYNGVDNEWWYNILSVNGVLNEDYSIRYEKEEEMFLKAAESISGVCQFKGNKFDIVLSKHK